MWVIFHVSRVQYLKCLIGLLHHKAVYFKIQAHSPLCFGMSLLLSSWRQAHQWWTVSASTPCARVSSFWARNEHVWKEPGRESPSSSLPCHPDLLTTTTTTTKVINNNQNTMCTMQRYNFCRYTELQPNCHPRTCCCYWGGGEGNVTLAQRRGRKRCRPRRGGGRTLSLAGVFQLRKSFLTLSKEQVNHRNRGACCSWPLPATAGQLGLSSGETVPAWWS